MNRRTSEIDEGRAKLVVLVCPIEAIQGRYQLHRGMYGYMITPMMIQGVTKYEIQIFIFVNQR